MTNAPTLGEATTGVVTPPGYGAHMNSNASDATPAPGWELVLCADHLTAGLGQLADQYDAHLKGQVDLGGNVGAQTPDDVIARANALSAWVERTTMLFTPQIVNAAFGEPNQPGNEKVIALFADSFVGIFAGILAWARNTRSVQAEPDWLPVYRALAAMADDPLRECRDFVTDFAQRAHTIADDLAAGRAPSVAMTLTLTVTISPEASDAFDKSLEALSPPRHRGLFERKK